MESLKRKSEATNATVDSEKTTQKRVKYGCSDATVAESSSSTSNARRRDEAYYFEDGSCVILVEDVLFNVHRTILSKDSSLFGVMFTLPQGEKASEGTSDDNPIVLAGDTPAEFRHFLWALYALPFELGAVTSSRADLTLMVDIAKVSNKYTFKSLETWALDTIQEYVSRKPSPFQLPAASSSSQAANPLPGTNADRSAEDLALADASLTLISLVRLAQTCGHSKLLTTLITILRSLISNSLRYAYLAMTLADELNIPALRGIAYMEIMQKATVVVIGQHSLHESLKDAPAQNDNSPCGALDADGRLIVSAEQQLRLLTGYHKLTSHWERLRTTPPLFDHASSCGATWHQHGCMQSWVEFWKEKTRTDSVLQLGLADVLGRLKAVLREFDRLGSATYMHHDCRLVARRMISAQMKQIEEGLAGFFEAM